MENNCLKTIHEVVACSGLGDTLNDAVDKAFQQMRIDIQKMIQHPIVSISTDEIKCIECQEVVSEEAYMFFFLKRKNVKTKVSLEIHLTVKYLNIGG